MSQELLQKVKKHLYLVKDHLLMAKNLLRKVIGHL